MSSAIIISAGLAALRGSIFGGWQIAPASWAARRATTARASATASPTASTPAIAATITAAIMAPITAAAKILAGTVVAAASGIVLCGIVMWRKVLRCGSVRIRLAFLGGIGVLVLAGSGRHFAVMLDEMFNFGSVRFLVGSLRPIRAVKLFRMKLTVVGFFVMFSGTR